MAGRPHERLGDRCTGGPGGAMRGNARLNCAGAAQCQAAGAVPRTSPRTVCGGHSSARGAGARRRTERDSRHAGTAGGAAWPAAGAPADAEASAAVRHWSADIVSASAARAARRGADGAGAGWFAGAGVITASTDQREIDRYGQQKTLDQRSCKVEP
jgi:hypothetical protein